MKIEAMSSVEFFFLSTWDNVYDHCMSWMIILAKILGQPVVIFLNLGHILMCLDVSLIDSDQAFWNWAISADSSRTVEISSMTCSE